MFELECIDRVYCNAYVPKLAYPGGVATFFTKHRGATFASTCLADPISKQFVAAIQRFAALSEIPIVRFEKGQRKDDVAQEQLARFGEPEGIYMIGVAQEKIRTFRTEKRRNPVTGVRYPWIVAASAMVNQYYLYGLDVEFGPFFVKFSATSRTGRSCASTAITGRSAKRSRRGSPSPRWTTGSLSAISPSGCSGSATASRRRGSTRSFAAGWRGCRTRSPGPTASPATAISSRSCRPNSR